MRGGVDVWAAFEAGGGGSKSEAERILAAAKHAEKAAKQARKEAQQAASSGAGAQTLKSLKSSRKS